MFAPIALSLLLSGSASAATPPWYEGPIISPIGQDYECFSGFIETRLSGYAGYAYRPPRQTQTIPWAQFPAVNEVFYAKVVLGHPGNPCTGSAVGVGVVLPPNASFAISAQNPLFCVARLRSGQVIDLANDVDYGCPQSVSYNGATQSYPLIPPRGGFIFNGQKTYTWGMAQGHWLEFLVPLKSSVAQTGSNQIAFRVNPDVGVVGYPYVALFVNNDTIFRSQMEDDTLSLDIVF